MNLLQGLLQGFMLQGGLGSTGQYSSASNPYSAGSSIFAGLASNAMSKTKQSSGMATIIMIIAMLAQMKNQGGNDNSSCGFDIAESSSCGGSCGGNEIQPWGSAPVPQFNASNGVLSGLPYLDGLAKNESFNPLPNIPALGSLDTTAYKNVPGVNNIKGVLPETFAKAMTLYTRAKAEGIDLKFTSGFRSSAKQNALYAQGRTTSGGRVTNARGGQSHHNWGAAFDVVVMKNGKIDWNAREEYARLGQIGKELGMTWGGDFKSLDDPYHFQLTPNIAGARAKYNESIAGKAPDVVAQVDQPQESTTQLASAKEAVEETPKTEDPAPTQLASNDVKEDKKEPITMASNEVEKNKEEPVNFMA